MKPLRLFPFADVRLALRRWRRRPGFAIAAILTLALGIGTATAIFSVVDAVILRPLPWPQPERLVMIYGVYPDRRMNPAYATTWNRGTITCPTWDALRQAPVFADVGVWTRALASDTTFGDARTEIVSTMEVSSNFFGILGKRITQGRGFSAGDDAKPTRVAIVPDETWRHRFERKSDIAGSGAMFGSASSGGRYPRTIVGVVEPSVRFDGDIPDFYFNVGTYGETCRMYDNGQFRAIARLADGVSIATAETQAQARVTAIPRTEPISVRLVPLIEDQMGQAARPLWIVFAGAGLLLLVSCSNVAGLLLGDARARRQEMGVRIALGASRFRVVRQLLVEHGLLAIAGSAVGLAAAFYLTAALVTIAPSALPRLETVAVDARVALFALVLGCATVLVFGVAPAVSISRAKAADMLPVGGREGRRGRLAGHHLVVAIQIALAIVLLVGTALFGETIFRLAKQPLGFNPSRLAVVSTNFTGSQSGDPATLRAAMGTPNFRDVLMAQMQRASTARVIQVMERLRSVPGVLDVAAASTVPFTTQPGPTPVSVHTEGQTQKDDQRAYTQTVTASYFKTMGMLIQRGRGFEDADGTGARVAVVSEAFENRFFPAGAVGRQFVVSAGITWTYEIVGVTGDVRRRDLLSDPDPLFYAFDRQTTLPRAIYVMRTAGDPEAVLAPFRQAIKEVDPQNVVTSATTMDVQLARLVAHERFRATLAACFGCAALLLAAVGLYGLAARRVADRRREFAVRVALGAAPANLRRLVFGDALVIVVIGLVVGVPAAVAASQVTQSFLFGVSATAPHVFVLASAVLAVASVFAMLGPARRAARLDPVAALKE